jgi:predicted enzyme related to lactoylglutathione lyase
MAAEAQGSFVWHELATNDMKAAERFYTKVVGWGAQPYEQSDEPYTMWTAAEVPQGGLMTLSETASANGARPMWLTYVSVPDVDRAVQKIQSLGGKLHYGPQDIPNVGRFAVVADPQGAHLAVFSPKGDPMPPSASGAGTFSWHELTTTDTNAAWRFYSEMFGWQKTDAMDLENGEVYQMFGVGGPSMGGMTKDAGAPPSWLPFAVVADLDASAKQAQASGGKVVLGPMEVPGGDRIAVVGDPQGAVLGLHRIMGG